MSNLVFRLRMMDTRISRSPAAFPMMVAFGTGWWTLCGSSTRLVGIGDMLASPVAMKGARLLQGADRWSPNVHPCAFWCHRPTKRVDFDCVGNRIWLRQ